MQEPTIDELAEWFSWANENDIRKIFIEKLYLCCSKGRMIYLFDKNFDIRSEDGMRKGARSQFYRFGERKLKAMEEGKLTGVTQLNIFD
jgi:hypothetical protein